MDDKLRRLQLCELEILDELVRLCEKNGLRYYLVGGTLLGAVRHQGFIPWDDDIDVAMPREDYDRLAEIASKELDAKYFFQSPETDPHYFLSYNKIRKNSTKVYEERFKDAKFHKGVFIDIFPLDFCPSPGLLCHFLFNVLAVMNYRGQVDSGERYTPYKELSGMIGYSTLRLLSPQSLLKLRKRLIKLSKQLSDGRFVASYAGAYGYRKEVFKTEWFENTAQKRFEQRPYFVPRAWQQLLGQWYGADWSNICNVPEHKRHIQQWEIKQI